MKKYDVLEIEIIRITDDILTESGKDPGYIPGDNEGDGDDLFDGLFG